MKLLTEYVDFNNSGGMILETVKSESGKVVMKGILQKSETMNQNGRVYPRHILEREIRNYQSIINDNRALGELDHPDSSVVSLENVSHIIREAHMEGDIVYGTIEVLNTPKGQILQSLVESGIKIGISSRGVGSTKKIGNHQEVQEDFQLICWDIVSEPSTPGAFVMAEGRDLSNKEIQEINNFFKRDDRIFRSINNILSWDQENKNGE